MASAESAASISRTATDWDFGAMAQPGQQIAEQLALQPGGQLAGTVFGASAYMTRAIVTVDGGWTAW